jgi:hypothetical protein
MLIKGEVLISTVTLNFSVHGKRYAWVVSVSGPGGVSKTDETVERHWAPLLDELLVAANDAVLRRRLEATP